MGWDVDEREDPAIAADLVSRACLRERISKRRKQPVILHADNGNAMHATTLESRLEELGALRSCSRPRVSNDNSHSDLLLRTVKYRPDDPRKPFASKGQACQWGAEFVDWYNQQHRPSNVRMVRLQRYAGTALSLYEQGRQRHPRHWSGSIRRRMISSWHRSYR